MARKLTAREKWDAALAAALKLAHAKYPYHVARVQTLNLPAVAPDMDAETALRIAQQIFEATPEEIAASSNANALYKPAMDGQKRCEPRRDARLWKNGVGSLIEVLRRGFPDLLSEPLTKHRLKQIQAWIGEKRSYANAHGVPIPPYMRKFKDDSLARAIRRAKKKAAATK